MNENIIVPHPLHSLLADRNRGRGRPDSNNRKNSDKGVFLFFFCNYIFFTVQKGRTFSGGGGVQLFFFFFFFWGGGGGGGVQILISIETYITCDFSGGGGGGEGSGLSFLKVSEGLPAGAVDYCFFLLLLLFFFGDGGGGGGANAYFQRNQKNL